MNKIPLILLSVLMTAGCTAESRINVAKAKFLCKDYGGLYQFNGQNKNVVTCKNGKKFDGTTLNSTIITDEKYYPKGEK